MNFIRRIGRDEIYIKYVHQLVNVSGSNSKYCISVPTRLQMHLQSQNYVEAALTLKLHSDLYRWDLNNFVPPMDDLGLPQQSQFHRKETLCLLILDYLGTCTSIICAIFLTRHIRKRKGLGTCHRYLQGPGPAAYRSHLQLVGVFAPCEPTHAELSRSGRLSEILRHQATLLEHIVTDQRYYSDYFLVTFYGNFPTAIRDKRFIVSAVFFSALCMLSFFNHMI
jgi:dedicator of cytokinesis protein 3